MKDVKQSAKSVGEKRKMDKISFKELYSIVKDISKTTLQIYLNNYRFTKFRLTYNAGTKAVYILNTDFLNMLYTMLLNRNKYKAAENLYNHFEDLNIKCLDWEVFICGNTV